MIKKDWKQINLVDVDEIQIGKTPSRSVARYWVGNLPWVTIRDLSKGRTVQSTNERIGPLTFSKALQI